ncbi:uncharacterized protein [Diabrotica undecimpunctata]|uniref:uncharacterized protein isoform X3 n=1 Tax=Diabrotica undecimpunctata TaxID=50387 RepID=UPI003B636733
MVRGISTNSNIRELVIKHYCRNKTLREIGDDLNIPKTTVWNIINHYEKTGSILFKKGKNRGRPKLVSDRNRRILVKVCTTGRRKSLRQVTDEWNRETGLNLSRECCRKWIHISQLKLDKAELQKTNGSPRDTRFKGQKRVTVDFENSEDVKVDPISITEVPTTTSTSTSNTPSPLERSTRLSSDKSVIQKSLENDADVASDKVSDHSRVDNDSPSEPESSNVTDAEEQGTLSAWARKERKFKCDLCTSSFKRASHLNRHQLVHTGERPFACEHCDKAFSRHDKLKNHVHKTHELGALNDALGPDSLYTIDRVDILTPEIMVKSENSVLTYDSLSGFAETTQKKRGRPRKYPISTPRDYVLNPAKNVIMPGKNVITPGKKRGRPRKTETPPKPLIKRPRGRPRLHPNGIGRPASYPQFFPDSFDSVGYITTKSHHPTLSDFESSQEMIYNSSEIDNNMDQIMMEPLVEIKTEQIDPEIKPKIEEDPLPPSSTSSSSFFENIGLYENTSAIAKIGECTISVATCGTVGPGHSGAPTNN